MLENLESRLIEEALDMVFKQVIEALKARRFWQRPAARRIVRTVGEKLDDLVRDLQPCFAPGEHTSILQVFYQAGPTRDESWNRVHEVLNVLGAWFREWDAMRQMIGVHRTPEILIRQFESLNAILAYVGLFVAEELHKRVQAGPEHVRVTYEATVGRYNHFLNQYEGLLRRLPQEVGIDPSPLGGQHFFIRL